MTSDDASAQRNVYELRVDQTISSFDEDTWDALHGVREHPYLRYSFIEALEKAGCAVVDEGWLPHHISLWKNDELCAVAPAYLKDHSQGEFVFDHGWANAARRFGVSYYPKLIVAVPFTPASGPRILTAEGAPPEVRTTFAAGLAQLVTEAGYSSAHILFPTDDEADELAGLGLAHRQGIQFHWRNEGFTSFEDFLKTLPSKKRTQLRRERKALASEGVTIATLRGKDITEEALDAMYRYYLATVEKFVWGHQYLNRDFFERVVQRMGNEIEIVLARRSGRPIAGAFNIVGAHAVFGRYWGCDVELPFLHFNVCYYHAIEQCIADRRGWFEPGAGGSHKAARGFFPTLTNSLHVIGNPTFRGAILDFCERERSATIEHVTMEWGAPPRRMRDAMNLQPAHGAT